ncbi:YdeI/OmpD-associated family protein [Dyadobacter fermentans]|uniref:YdeI/OmpD-associated family protein n=1 Tax=Dyadobacter fermentans TaxID=94254 RepID=UPI001CBF354F|nr:YdeI/OmpD-associated family protein [Dyadobacter fermentans]MBZ1359916.1 YdeI/OmpD-associated family protein [Dyadobacter fermentans]
METKNGIEAITAPSSEEWRAWMAKNGTKKDAVFLIIYHKDSPTPSIGYKESIEHALCYGWIDSKAIKRDTESFYLTFTKRNPKSKWSIVNKERAARMTKAGLMRPEGQAMIDLAKETGAWDALETAGNAVIPDDLQQALDANQKAFENFARFAPSSKRLILEWILNAKRPETREKRIMQSVEMAARNERANHPR